MPQPEAHLPETPSNRSNAAANLLRQPLLWGGMATAAFYGAIYFDFLQGEFVERYFLSHPVEHASTGLFFVGIAALLIKWCEVQFAGQVPSEPLLGPMPPVRQSPQQAELILSVVERQPPALLRTYLARRIQKALAKVKLNGSAESLESDLRNLADDDALAAHQGYALVRIIVWAIPILGFLGTVIGITLAVAELKPSNLDDIGPVVAGLSVAFDTTALALALSMVLMFAMYFTTQAENKALAVAERRAEAELVGRFVQAAKATDDGAAGAIRAAADEMIRATERLVERQAEVWKATIDSAHARWNQLTQASEQQLALSLEKALLGSFAKHYEHLQQVEQTSGRQTQQRWEQLVAGLQESTAAVGAQQAELRKQGELMLQIVDATGRVIKLEDALNENLATLAHSGNFEEAVGSLSAAISLLNVRAGGRAAEMPQVEITPRPKSTKTKGQAA